MTEKTFTDFLSLIRQKDNVVLKGWAEMVNGELVVENIDTFNDPVKKPYILVYSKELSSPDCLAINRDEVWLCTREKNTEKGERFCVVKKLDVNKWRHVVDEVFELVREQT